MYPPQPPPVMLPPLHYQGLDAAQPFGYQPPPAPMMAPGRMPGMGPPLGGPQPGMVRSADEMGGDENAPPAKRQKVQKLPGGAYYPEDDWINMHPVSYIFASGLAMPLLICILASHFVADPNAQRLHQGRVEARRHSCHHPRPAAQLARLYAS